MFKFKLVRDNKEGHQPQHHEKRVTKLPFFNISSSPISRLKIDLNELNRESSQIGDDDLWQRYSNLFQQYFSQNTTTSSKPMSEVVRAKDDNMDLVPIAYRERARKLVTLIDTNIKTQNKWSLDNTRLYENGYHVEGNFIDWILYAMTTRKLVEPLGFTDFQRLLNELNIPQTYMIRPIKRRSTTTRKRRRITSPPAVTALSFKSPVRTGEESVDDDHDDDVFLTAKKDDRIERNKQHHSKNRRYAPYR